MITERLRLRPIRPSDAEAIHAIQDLVGQGRADRTIDELRSLYTQMEAMTECDPGWHGFVIELHDGTVIGDVGYCLDQPEERQAEIGYGLHPDFWGAGYATEALTGMLRMMLTGSTLHRVVAITKSANLASRRLLERLGFRLEGQYQAAFYDYRAKVWVDSVGYALLASEWNEGLLG